MCVWFTIVSSQSCVSCINVCLVYNCVVTIMCVLYKCVFGLQLCRHNHVCPVEMSILFVIGFVQESVLVSVTIVCVMYKCLLNFDLWYHSLCLAHGSHQKPVTMVNSS